MRIETPTEESDLMKQKFKSVLDEIKQRSKTTPTKEARSPMSSVQNTSRHEKTFASEAKNALWFAVSFGLVPKAVLCKADINSYELYVVSKTHHSVVGVHVKYGINC